MRIVYEAIQNMDKYLDNRYVSIGAQNYCYNDNKTMQMR